jgi:phosphoribosylamine--glycine ligase
MRVLLIGSGGREHALAYALLKDPVLTTLHVAPGNPGIATLKASITPQIHPISIDDHAALLALAQSENIDLVVVGPEKPLVDGLADLFRANNIAVFGPSSDAAQLEGSKHFAKEIMAQAGVPTAKSFTCTNKAEIDEALDFFEPSGNPFVVKHDGLAAGKGVVVTLDRAAAKAHALLSSRNVIEEYLDGPEVSLFGISDGTNVVAMQPAQDFKRVGDGDLGPNTGGMGAYSPLPWLKNNSLTGESIVEEVHRTILLPMIKTMAERGTPFIGLLYAGLAITKNGIRVIEFNARFGDPETQVLLPRLKTPLASLLYRAATGAIAPDEKLDWSKSAAVTVVLASDGYPENPQTGEPITGADQAPTDYDSIIFHAGTKLVDGILHSSGGRVITVTGLGADLAAARGVAYERISSITLRGSHYRRDIALSASQSEG